MSFDPRELREPSLEPRWIVPFPDTTPELRVRMRNLPDQEVQQVLDSMGMKTDRERNSYARTGKVGKEMVRRAVEDWEGFLDHGQPLPCSDQNKVRLLSKMVPKSFIEMQASCPPPDGAYDGQTHVPMWQVLQLRFRETEEEEEKNS